MSRPLYGDGAVSDLFPVRQAWLEAHPGWDVVPDQTFEEAEEEEEEEEGEDDKTTEEGKAEGTAELTEGAEGSSKTTVKHAVDDEYKKAEGEANYYRYGRPRPLLPCPPKVRVVGT